MWETEGLSWEESYIHKHWVVDFMLEPGIEPLTLDSTTCGKYSWTQMSVYTTWSLQGLNEKIQFNEDRFLVKKLMRKPKNASVISQAPIL